MNDSSRTLVLIIAVFTGVSGILQMLMPSLVLKAVGADITTSTTHFFAIIGMFMALFSGLMIHVVYSEKPNPDAVLWCALQKLGAFVAVGLGIMNEVFSLLAIGIALFDLFSGLLFFYYYKTILEAHEVA